MPNCSPCGSLVHEDASCATLVHEDASCATRDDTPHPEPEPEPEPEVEPESTASAARASSKNLAVSVVCEVSANDCDAEHNTRELCVPLEDRLFSFAVPLRAAVGDDSCHMWCVPEPD